MFVIAFRRSTTEHETQTESHHMPEHVLLLKPSVKVKKKSKFDKILMNIERKGQELRIPQIHHHLQYTL